MDERNERLLDNLTKTVDLQSGTIKELLDICTMLKDRIDVLEEKAKR